jgi:hypothetical protein
LAKLFSEDDVLREKVQDADLARQQPGRPISASSSLYSYDALIDTMKIK